MQPETTDLGNGPTIELAPGVDARLLGGERSMLSLAELQPGAVVPAHSHPQEQLGLVVRGEITIRISDTTTTLGPLEAFAVPGDTEHHVIAGPDGALVLDAFAPPREDLRERWLSA